jgi:hypothetical protein
VSNATATLWSVVGAPGGVTFGDVTQPATTVRFSAAGSYSLRLAASNAFAQVSSDLAVNVAQARPQLSLVTVSNGAFQFQIDGGTAMSYTVQFSSNLVTWTNLFVTNPVTMPFEWSSGFVTNIARGFYRVTMGM